MHHRTQLEVCIWMERERIAFKCYHFQNAISIFVDYHQCRIVRVVLVVKFGMSFEC